MTDAHLVPDAAAEAAHGLDAERAGDWLARQVPELAPPFAFSLIAGGRSNLTYAARDAAGGAFVLRRPPLGHVLESAHDMGREHRILRALASTGVPVPAPLAFCDDPGVIGAPFYVMRLVPGLVLRELADVERELPRERRHAAGVAMVDALACLHALDPDAAGLGELGRREGYVERQLRRWHRQWREGRTRELPALEEAHRRLEAHVPPQARTSIVHGDYRIDNLIFTPEGGVAAVLDWELCTLGDPLADLGQLMVYWLEPGEDGTHLMGRAPTTAPGFPSRAELLARYAERTGGDLSGIDYYTALGYWKLACIGEGVYARYRAGAMGDDVDLGLLERHVPLLAELALAASERCG